MPEHRPAGRGLCGLTVKNDPFLATPAQFGGAAAAMVALVVAALRFPRHAAREPGSVPRPLLIGAVGLVAGSCFLLIPRSWGWSAVAAYLALDAAVIVLISMRSRSTDWSALHRLALAGGAAAAYAWHAFPQPPVLNASKAVDLAGNAIFAAGLVLLLMIAGKGFRTKSLYQNARRQH